MNRRADNQRRQPRGNRDRSRDDRGGKEAIDKDFQREIEMRIGYFLESDEKELELEAMNSYRRRMVHTVAKGFNLESESRGEDRDRYVILIKTEETKEAPKRAPRLWDFGSQAFPVHSGSKGVHLALKVDGSLELYQEGNTRDVVADRVVTAKEVRIRKGRILQPGEEGY